jgi:hypothetical protein
LLPAGHATSSISIDGSVRAHKLRLPCGAAIDSVGVVIETLAEGNTEAA